MKAKAKKQKPVYLTIRKFWSLKPTTRIKPDTKKDVNKKACRVKENKEDA